MVFYLDLIFILNFVIDYFILLATKKFLHLSTKIWRLGISAAVGAVYTILFFLPAMTFFHTFVTKIVISVFMVLIAFGFIHLIQFIQTLAVFYFVSFLTGGGVFALQYFFQMEHDVINGVYVSRSSSPFMVLFFILAAFAGIWLFSNRTYRSLHRKNDQQQQIVNLEIYIDEKSYPCKGLIDTGNRLYDPISRNPVIILEAKAADFIPSIFEKAYKEGEFRLELFDRFSRQVDPLWLSRIHIIPYRTITKEKQFILAIRPDKVLIYKTEEKLFNHTKVLIGLNYGNLSNDKSFQAIIHPDLLAG